MKSQISESSQSEVIGNSLDQRIHWRILIGLASVHLLLLTAVYFLPVLISGRDALFNRWSRLAHGTLNGVQFDLLAVFWGISHCDWPRRTSLFSLGIVILSLAHVGVMFPLAKNYDGTSMNLTLDLLINTVQVFAGRMLVVAILIDSFRPLWGSLAREVPKTPEQITIFSIMRKTTICALAAMVLKSTGEFTEGLSSITSFCTSSIIRTLFLASCVWMMFARSHNWIGCIGWLVALAVEIMNAPEATVSMQGYGFYAIYMLANTIWLCATFYVVRYFGFRLQKYAPHNTESIASSPAHLAL